MLLYLVQVHEIPKKDSVVGQDLFLFENKLRETRQGVFSPRKQNSSRDHRKLASRIRFLKIKKIKLNLIYFWDSGIQNILKVPAELSQT